MAEKDFAWKNLLANMRSACQVLNPTLVSFMKAKISEIEKATVSLNDFVLNRRPVFFFYELYNRNHIRFSQDFKEIISGLINFILKHPGDFKFSELKSEELELIRFVPGQLTEPIILENALPIIFDGRDMGEMWENFEEAGFRVQALGRPIASPGDRVEGNNVRNAQSQNKRRVDDSNIHTHRDRSASTKKIQQLMEAARNNIRGHGVVNYLPQLHRLPHLFHRYIERVEDVQGDGHCGYRAIAGFVGYGDDWKRVRTEMLNTFILDRAAYTEEGRYKYFEDNLNCNTKSTTRADYYLILPEM